MNLPGLFQDILATNALPAFFLFLLLYSFMLPITEEIALILVGVVAHGLDRPMLPVLLVAYPGIVCSDIGYYWLARHFGGRLLRSNFFRKLVNPRKVEATEIYFKNRGPRVAFFCRFLVGIRAPAIITVGILRMPFKLFALYDGLAAAVTTSVWLSLGYYWGRMLTLDLSTLGTFFAVLAPVALLAVAALMYTRIKKSYEEAHGSGYLERVDTAAPSAETREASEEEAV